MAYADLTAEEKDSVQACSNTVRILTGEFARLLEKFQAIVAYYTGNVETILATLNGSDVVPNGTNYFGAQDMTKEELQNLIGYLITSSNTGDGASGSYNTNYHRSLYAKACGPSNMISE